MRRITPNEVLAGQWTLWKKTASTRIKKLLTQADVEAEPEAFFFDLEGRRHDLKVGRCICVGIEGERWSCSLTSVERDRDPIGEVDEHGYQGYKLKNPRPVQCFDIPFSFTLLLAGKAPWVCEEQTGAIITWNGEQGSLLDMRVIKRSVFEQTYEREA